MSEICARPTTETFWSLRKHFSKWHRAQRSSAKQKQEQRSDFPTIAWFEIVASEVSSTVFARFPYLVDGFFYCYHYRLLQTPIKPILNTNTSTNTNTNTGNGLFHIFIAADRPDCCCFDVVDRVVSIVVLIVYRNTWTLCYCDHHLTKFLSPRRVYRPL